MHHQLTLRRALSRRALIPLLLLVAALAAASRPPTPPPRALSSARSTRVEATPARCFTNDFVELFNRGATAVDLTGWTIQYATAAGTSWQATPLAGSIAPGRRYLVQLASAAAVGAALPTPDATGTTNLAASGGKIALVRDATALTCGATAGSCAAVRRSRISSATAPPPTSRGRPPPARSAARQQPFAQSAAAPTPMRTPPTSLSRPRPAELVRSRRHVRRGAPAGRATSQGATVDADVQPVLASRSSARPSASGRSSRAATPAALAEHVIVSSNRADRLHADRSPLGVHARPTCRSGSPPPRPRAGS